MNSRLRIHDKRLQELLDILDKDFSENGFDRDKLIQLTEIQVPDCLRDEDLTKKNLQSLGEISKQVKTLPEFFEHDVNEISLKLDDIKRRLQHYLDELQNGANIDRVFYSVMRYLIYFRLKGEILYSYAVGICVHSLAVPASEFGLPEEKNPSLVFDASEPRSDKRRFVERIKKRYDRLFEKYDTDVLSDWEPAVPVVAVSKDEKEKALESMAKLSEHIGEAFDELSEKYIEEKKNRKRGPSGVGLFNVHNAMRDAKRPKKPRTRRHGK